VRTAAVLGFLTLAALAHPAHAASVEECSDAYTKGQEERLAGRLMSAREQFKLCSDPTCPTAVIPDCVRWITEVEADLPTVEVKASSVTGEPIENLNFWVDGVAIPRAELTHPVVVDAGPHVMRFEAPGYEPVQITNSMRPEDRKVPVVAVMRLLEKPVTPGAAAQESALKQPTPEVNDHHTPVAALALAGVGLVALGGSVYFDLSAKHKYDDRLASCGHLCPESDASSVRSKALIADIALATSVVAFGAAAWFYFSERSDRRPSTALGIEPRPEGAQARLRLTF
jgi:hypothetical protein